MHGFERNEAGKVFVGGLSWDTTKDSLLEYFSQYGEVIDCVVMKNPETGKSRGFGFVTYRDTSCVDTVLSVPAHIVDGRQVDPKACNPKGANRGGGGGGSGGGGHMGGDQHRPNRGPRGGGGGGPHGDKKIFLGGLPNGVDEEAIRSFFSQYGKVLEVTVMYDAQKQRSRGFGFLTFESEDAVNQVCREHYVNFNGKKVECKRATPRNQGNQGHQGQLEEHHQPPPQQIHVSHPGGMPHMEMGIQPPPGTPGGMPGTEPQWSTPEAWNAQVHQSAPGQPIGVPAQFQHPGVQFQHGYQTEVQSGAPPGWPPQAPIPAAVTAAGWPPGAPPQPGVAPPAQFTVAQTFAQPAPVAPVYQYTAAAPGQPPAANGQSLPQMAIAQPPPSSYGYTTTSYASPAVALPQAAGTIAGRPYQDFTSPQAVQVATTVAAIPGAAPPVSTAVSYSYPSPYGSPIPAGAAPAAADPYAQAAALGHPQGTVAVPGVPPPSGQPAGVPGYGSAIAPAPGSAGDPAAPKAVDYSSYYSAYGYAVETSPTAVSAAAYGAPPAPAPAPAPAPGQAPYAVQEVPQAVAYGSSAPGPSPTFQRQSSAQQYHPYARR